MARLYFRQLLAGRDFAADDRLASSMVNFVYAIGDLDAGEAVLVDPAYDTAALVDVLAADGLALRGVVATHYHADHIGGSLMGHEIEGIGSLLDAHDVPVHVQAPERRWIERTTGVSDALVEHASGDVVRVGDLELTLVHTPGHTPGSQCLLVEGHLVTGDTLFIDGCGRTDLPGSDPNEMYVTLTSRLAQFDAAVEVYPGHAYSPEPHLSMGVLRSRNPVLASLGQA